MLVTEATGYAPKTQARDTIRKLKKDRQTIRRLAMVTEPWTTAAFMTGLVLVVDGGTIAQGRADAT